MTTTAAPKAGYEVRSDDWLASILKRPAARLILDDDTLPCRAELENALASKSWYTNPSGIGSTQLGPKGFVDCKIATSRVDQLHLLSNVGMKVVDVNVTSELLLANHIKAERQWSIESDVIGSAEASAEQIAGVLQVAESAFRFSRFHLDPQVDNVTANRLKRDWLENSISGERGDRVWIALDGQERVAGFLTSLLVREGNLDTGREVAVIDLIAVATESQGKGVGRALTNQFLGHYASAGVNCFRVGTQVANLSAQRLYQSFGFRSISSTYVMHGHY